MTSVTTGRRVRPGSRFPLGATPDQVGTNFALFSENATRVELCLFDEFGNQQQCVSLPEVSAHVWHGYLPGVGPGQRYGYHVKGPWKPKAGHRFNPAKLLIDPYAKALTGAVDWDAPVFGYPLGQGHDLVRDKRDDAWGVPKGIVIADTFDWGDGRRPNIALHDSVIYELHVKGFTARHPDLPPDLRGTYAGLAAPPVIAYLKDLGVTAVELLPVHAFLDDRHLLEQGLRNYWGYNTIGYFAPEARYASSGDAGGQVGEFKGMVKALHAAGIEVILDVVYNHTGEGNHTGADPLLPRHRQRQLLPAGGGRAALLHRLHRHRQHPQRRPPSGAATHHGLPALLGDGDARRRLPLRPRLRPGPRVLRRRPPRLLLRRHPPGPRPLPGEAHRRAVGHRRGRLSGRQLPGPLERVERQVPGQRARLLEGRRRPHLRAGLPADGIVRPLPGGWPAAAGQHQLHHRPRRLHPAGPGQLQREAQRGQRRREPRRPRTTISPGTTAWRGRRTTRRSSPPASGRSATSWPRSSSRRGCPMLWPRRRGGADTGWEQQRLLPGQRDGLGRLGPRRPHAGVPRLHARPDRPARAASQPGPAPLSRGAAYAVHIWKTWPGSARTASR